jgi:hypothetical protein
MTKGMKCSKWALTVAIASVAASLGALMLAAEIKGRLAHRVSDACGERRRFEAKLAALSDFDGAHLRALSESVDQFRHRLGEPSTWAQALGHLGGQWINEADASTEHGAYATKVHRIRMAAPSVAEWPRIIDTAGLLERCPGVQIEGIEMKSSGTAAQRSLDYVGLRLVVQMRSENGQNPTR